MTVSVLIVSWHSREPLARALAALSAAPPACPTEIIVIDNASQDGTAEMIARDFPSVRCIASSRNLGFAGGVNAGRRHATGQYLLLLNPDAEPRAGALERLVSTLEHDRALGAAAGRLVDADGRTQVGFNVRRLPTLPSLLCDLLFVARLWPGNPASSRYVARDLDQDAPADVEQPAAAALMVRADVFDQLGGFDEVFHPAWWEDVDFCRRLLATGRRIRYDPSAIFVHQGGHSLAYLTRAEFLRVYYANLVRYVRKHHGAAAGALIRTLAPIGAGLRRWR